MISLKSYRDDDGEFVREGDQISFCYGTPPVGVFAFPMAVLKLDP